VLDFQLALGLAQFHPRHCSGRSALTGSGLWQAVLPNMTV
jgi:hypothetical protein